MRYVPDLPPDVDELERMTPAEREAALDHPLIPDQLREDLLDELEEGDW